MAKGWGAFPQVNVMAFGAQGNGIHDDWGAIQAAINAVPDAGGTVAIPYGTFLISDALTITKQKVSIVGQGIGTILQATNLTKDMFLLGDGNVTYADLALRHMKLTASGQKTSNSGIKLNKCFKVWLDGLFVEKQYRALHILNSTQVWITNCPIRDTKENGITIEAAINNGYDWYINNVVMDNPDVTNAGIGIQWLGGETLVMSGADIMRFVTGMDIDAANGKEARWGFFTNVILDTCSDNGLHVGNTGTGNVAGLTFTNCWTSTNTNYGVLIDKNGTGYVEGIRFIGHKAMNNGLAGFRLAGGEDLHVLASDVVSNSATVSNTRHGVEVTTTTDWSVQGCRITNGYGHGASQANGINVDAGAADNYMILNNDLRGNANSAMSNGATGTTRKIANNLGYVTENRGSSSIDSGQTTKQVAHGLSVTPNQINITFKEQGTSDYGRWWVSGVDGTNLTLNVSADPGASNLDFDWQAIFV